MERSRQCTWTIENDIGILTIDHPPKNYLLEAEFVSLEDLRRWTGAPGLKAVIVTGAGRHFSAGADRDRLFAAAEDPSTPENMRRGAEALLHLEELELPVIAAIRGACMGGGLEIALACGIRICAENALLSFPESGLNLLPGLNGTVRLPRLVGRARSMELVLSGGMISGREALACGLVDHVVPSSQVFEAALSLAREMTGDRPVKVIRCIMRALNNARRLPPDEAAREEAKLFCELAADEAQRRGREGA